MNDPISTSQFLKDCPHDIACIRVIHTVCTCETTVLVCAECGKELSEPKTEC